MTQRGMTQPDSRTPHEVSRDNAMREVIGAVQQHALGTISGMDLMVAIRDLVKAERALAFREARDAVARLM